MSKFTKESANREENSSATAELQKISVKDCLLIQVYLFIRVSSLINKSLFLQKH